MHYHADICPHITPHGRMRIWEFRVLDDCNEAFQIVSHLMNSGEEMISQHFPVEDLDWAIALWNEKTGGELTLAEVEGAFIKMHATAQYQGARDLDAEEEAEC